MAVDEEARRGIYEKIEASYGVKVAKDMMQHLPQGGADALARKDDLVALEQRLVAQMEVLRHELIAEIHIAGRKHLMGFATIMAVFNASVFAALTFIRF